jgi:hypothetical protein
VEECSESFLLSLISLFFGQRISRFLLTTKASRLQCLRENHYTLRRSCNETYEQQTYLGRPALFARVDGRILSEIRLQFRVAKHCWNISILQHSTVRPSRDPTIAESVTRDATSSEVRDILTVISPSSRILQ